MQMLVQSAPAMTLPIAAFTPSNPPPKLTSAVGELASEFAVELDGALAEASIEEPMDGVMPANELGLPLLVGPTVVPLVPPNAPVGLLPAGQSDLPSQEFTLAVVEIPEPARTSLPEAPVPTEIDIAIVEVEPSEDLGEAPDLGWEELVEVVPPDDGDDSLEETPEDDAASEAGHRGDAPEVQAMPLNGERRRIVAGSRVETPNGFKTRIDTHNVELANRIELMAATRAREGVVVQLEPENLGAITLLVAPEGSGVRTEIGATNEQVRAALEKSQPALQRQLELRGVAVASVSVSSETSNHHPRGGGSFGHRPQPQAFLRGNPLVTSFLEVAPLTRSRAVSASGLEIWI
jgi:hypothetical protein